jgi:hypothetical protein
LARAVMSGKIASTTDVGENLNLEEGMEPSHTVGSVVGISYNRAFLIFLQESLSFLAACYVTIQIEKQHFTR